MSSARHRRSGRVWWLIVLLCAINALVSAGVYSSLNGWQWSLWKRAALVSREGTQSARDLSMYSQDRMVTWAWKGQDPSEAGVQKIESGLARIGDHVIVPRDWLSRQGIAWMCAAFAAILACVIAGPAIGVAMSMRRHRNGFSQQLRLEPLVRAACSVARIDVSSKVAASLPVLAAITWYVWFDRNQNTSFVGETFTPSWAELVTFGLVVVFSGWLAAMRCAPRCVRAVVSAEVLERWRGCQRCGYTPGPGVTRCPECGSQVGCSDRHESVTTTRRFKAPRYAAGVGGIAAACIAVLCVLQPAWFIWGLGRHFGLGMVINWLSLRGESIDTSPIATFNAGEVVQLSWDDQVRWLMVREADFDPKRVESPHGAFVWVIGCIEQERGVQASIRQSTGAEQRREIRADTRVIDGRSQSSAEVSVFRWPGLTMTFSSRGEGRLQVRFTQRTLSEFERFRPERAPPAVLDSLSAAIRSTVHQSAGVLVVSQLRNEWDLNELHP